MALIHNIAGQPGRGLRQGGPARRREEPPKEQFVVFSLAGKLLGLPAVKVKEMLVVPEVTEVPHNADYIRGVIDLRGWVMPLFDLRKRLGMPSSSEEMEGLIRLIEHREEDHKQWLDALFTSVETGAEFTLPRDHDRCSFGRWYAGFSAGNSALGAALKAMERPHRKIHAVANEILACLARGEPEKAQGILQWNRDVVFNKLDELFAEVRRVIIDSHREIALVLESGGQFLALSVDEVDSVEELGVDREGSGRQPWGGGGLLAKVGKRADGGLIFILDAVDFFMEAEGMRL